MSRAFTGSIHAFGIVLAMLIGAVDVRAAAITILSENFNAVSLAGDQVRSVDEILANSPGELSPGMIAVSSGASPNVRRPGNVINTNPAPDGFGGVFGSKFLVLGDDRGGIGGNPSGADEDTGVFIPFTIPSVATRIRVSFDWAFDGTDISDNRRDVFLVGILGSSTAAEVLFRRSPGGFGSDTSFARSFDIPLELPAGDYLLGFILDESGNGDGRTNTAVGIDNIRIRAQVPLPGTLALLALGLAAFGARRAAIQTTR